jgi:hypothetical protein
MFTDVSEVLAAFSILLMKDAACISETSVNYQTIPRNNPYDSHLQLALFHLTDIQTG